MNTSQQEIVALYEQQELTVPEIAGALRVDDDYVRGTLMQFSAVFKGEVDSKYKEAKKAGPVSECEFNEFVDEYKNLARETDNPYLKERTLRYLMNEYQGRNEVAALMKVRGTGDVKIQINMFNDALKAARNQAEKIVKGGETK